MRCEDMLELIGPYIDGELGLMRGVEVERHLEDCTICSQEYDNHRTLRKAFRADDLYFRPSETFEKRLEATLRRQVEPVETRTRRFSWRWFSVVAAAAVVVIVAALAIGLFTTRSAG